MSNTVTVPLNSEESYGFLRMNNFSPRVNTYYKEMLNDGFNIAEPVIPTSYVSNIHKIDSVMYFIERILETGLINVETVNNKGQTLLHWFCDGLKIFDDCMYSETINAIKLLLRRGANINALDNYGNNALFYVAGTVIKPVCCAISLLRITFLLIERGIDLEHKNKYGLTIEDYLCSNKWVKLETNDFILTSPHVLRILMYTLVQLYKKRSKVNFDNMVSHGHDGSAWCLELIDRFPRGRKKIHLIRHLIENGIDVNATSIQYRNNLLIMLMESYSPKYGDWILSCVHSLIAQVENLNHQNFPLENALNVLCSRSSSNCDSNCFELVKLLIGYGVDVNCKNIHGENALLTFVYCRARATRLNKWEYSVLGLLIKHTNDVNATNRVGKTALDLLCTSQSLVLKELYDVTKYFIKECGIPSQSNPLLRLIKNRILKKNELFFEARIENEEKYWFRIIRMFLQNGADNLKTKTKDKTNNVLSLICRYYDGSNIVDIVSLLCEYGFEVNERFSSGIERTICYDEKMSFDDWKKVLGGKQGRTHQETSSKLNVLDSMLLNSSQEDTKVAEVYRLLVQHGLKTENISPAFRERIVHISKTLLGFHCDHLINVNKHGNKCRGQRP